MVHPRRAALLALLGVVVALWLAVPPVPHSSRPAPAALPPERPELAVLRRFARLDLTGAEPDALTPLRAALRSLDPERVVHLMAERRRLGWENESLDQSELWCALTPRAVWPYRPGGWVVFEREFFPQPHPGSTTLGLTYLDARGVVRARGTLTTGWRRYLNEARLLAATGFDGPVVLVDTVAFHGHDGARQFYAVVGGRVDLVRLEREDGTPTRNTYVYIHVRAGPMLSQSAAQWEADLMSPDRGRVLRALAWLGGYHADQLRPGEERRRDMEAAADAELPRIVRARPAVVARLRQLAGAAKAWEREGALMALDLVDKP